MFNRILVPLDGSQLAEMALPYGLELAARLNSELVLFHVCGPEHRDHIHMHEIYLAGVADNMKRDFQTYAPTNIQLKVSTVIETGGPCENICSLVENNNISLIVMTAFGASGIKVGKMIGSVTDHICRNVPVPVMLIRHQITKSPKSNSYLLNKALIALDNSALSRKAVPIGEELAGQLRIPVTLFQMAHIEIPYGGSDAPYINYRELTEAEKSRIQKVLEIQSEKLKDEGLKADSQVISGTNAGDEIILECEKIGADLVIMSTHARSGLGRIMMGSVAEKVLYHSEIPLMLVHASAG